MATGFVWQLTIDERTVDCRVRQARAFFERLRGLLGYPPLSMKQALLISPCNNVHTFGMRYAIDVVYLSADGHIVQLRERVAPRRMSACASGKQVLEFAQGAIAHFNLQVGQHLGCRQDVIEDA